MRSDGLVNEYDYFAFNNNLEDLPGIEKNCKASVMHSTISTQTDFDFNCNISNYKIKFNFVKIKLGNYM